MDDLIRLQLKLSGGNENELSVEQIYSIFESLEKKKETKDNKKENEKDIAGTDFPLYSINSYPSSSLLTSESKHNHQSGRMSPSKESIIGFRSILPLSTNFLSPIAVTNNVYEQGEDKDFDVAQNFEWISSSATKDITIELSKSEDEAYRNEAISTISPHGNMKESAIGREFNSEKDANINTYTNTNTNKSIDTNTNKNTKSNSNFHEFTDPDFPPCITSIDGIPQIEEKNLNNEDIADENKNSENRQQNKRYNVGQLERIVTSNKKDEKGSDKIRCKCQLLAKLRTVYKDGVNQGRYFYSCSRKFNTTNNKYKKKKEEKKIKDKIDPINNNDKKQDNAVEIIDIDLDDVNSDSASPSKGKENGKGKSAILKQNKQSNLEKDDKKMECDFFKWADNIAPHKQKDLMIKWKRFGEINKHVIVRPHKYHTQNQEKKSNDDSKSLQTSVLEAKTIERENEDKNETDIESKRESARHTVSPLSCPSILPSSISTSSVSVSCIPSSSFSSSSFSTPSLPSSLSSSSPWRFSAKDIKQGGVGDCWFLSALAVVAEKPDYIERIVVNKELNKEGKYAFNLHVDGRWKPWIVDNYLPVFEYNELARARQVGAHNLKENVVKFVKPKQPKPRCKIDIGKILQGRQDKERTREKTIEKDQAYSNYDNNDDDSNKNRGFDLLKEKEESDRPTKETHSEETFNLKEMEIDIQENSDIDIIEIIKPKTDQVEARHKGKQKQKQKENENDKEEEKRSKEKFKDFLNYSYTGYSLCYTKASHRQLWVPLLEKAYAKAHGSYHAISGGWIAEGLYDLTGCPTETISFSRLNQFMQRLQYGDHFNLFYTPEFQGSDIIQDVHLDLSYHHSGQYHETIERERSSRENVSAVTLPSLDLDGLVTTFSQMMEDLWIRILSYKEQHFLMGASCSRSAQGLIGCHAYSILDVIQLDDKVIGRQKGIKDYLASSSSKLTSGNDNDIPIIYNQVDVEKEEMLSSKSEKNKKGDKEETRTTIVINLDEMEIEETENLKFQNTVNKNSVTTSKSSPKPKTNGLDRDKGKVKDRNGQTLRLIKIRNPWGKAGMYRGKFGSRKGVEWTRELLNELEPGDGTDGIFYIQFEDFVELFCSIDICKVFSNWYSLTFMDTILPYEYHGNYSYNFKIHEPTWTYLTITQPTKRGKTKGVDSLYWYSDLSMLVYKYKKVEEEYKENYKDEKCKNEKVDNRKEEKERNDRDIEFDFFGNRYRKSLERIVLNGQLKVSHTEIILDDPKAYYTVFIFSFNRCVGVGNNIKENLGYLNQKSQSSPNHQQAQTNTSTYSSTAAGGSSRKQSDRVVNNPFAIRQAAPYSLRFYTNKAIQVSTKTIFPSPSSSSSSSCNDNTSTTTLTSMMNSNSRKQKPLTIRQFRAQQQRKLWQLKQSIKPIHNFTLDPFCYLNRINGLQFFQQLNTKKSTVSSQAFYYQLQSTSVCLVIFQNQHSDLAFKARCRLLTGSHSASASSTPFASEASYRIIPPLSTCIISCLATSGYQDYERGFGDNEYASSLEISRSVNASDIFPLHSTFFVEGMTFDCFPAERLSDSKSAESDLISKQLGTLFEPRFLEDKGGGEDDKYNLIENVRKKKKSAPAENVDTKSKLESNGDIIEIDCD